MMDGEAEVIVQIDEGICTLTLNAVARRNALSLEMREQLRERLREAMTRRDVRALVLTGAGKTFSAGGDIRKMLMPGEHPDPMLARQRLDVLHDIVRLLIAGPKPVVAAIEGFAFGAGFSLALACDHVVVAEGASFSAAFGRIGLVADCGLLWTLPQRVGMGSARDLLLTGRKVDAAQALRIGIADALVPQGEALAAARNQARLYLPIAPLALAATKSALARRPASLDDALSIEADLQASLRVSQDHADACRAFLSKRTATFQGR
jgi:enoyl-CoA hydratase/carnithine racemase